MIGAFATESRTCIYLTFEVIVRIMILFQLISFGIYSHIIDIQNDDLVAFDSVINSVMLSSNNASGTFDKDRRFAK